MSRLPLYLHYPGQSHPQPAFLWITPERAGWGIQYDVNGAVPPAAEARCELWLSAEPYLTHDDLLSMSKDLAPLTHRIQAGLELRWDGRRYVGELSEDATCAVIEAEFYLIDMAAYSEVEFWRAEDWFQDEEDALNQLGRKSIATCTDTELIQLAARLEDKAIKGLGAPSPVILANTIDFLRRVREDQARDGEA